MSDERMFPIQSERGAAPHPRRIPWSVAEKAYSVYSARYGNDQSMERMAERGGFGPGEMDTFLPGWREECAEIATLRAALEGLQRENEQIRAQRYVAEERGQAMAKLEAEASVKRSEAARLTAESALAEARAETAGLNESVAALEERDRWPKCACSYDKPTDVCAVHSPRLAREEARALAAESALATARAEGRREGLLEGATDLESRLPLVLPGNRWLVIECEKIIRALAATESKETKHE